jgi:diguanylate cyclase (GGDEF)-like protein/PAS domain S-box-containing protein
MSAGLPGKASQAREASKLRFLTGETSAQRVAATSDRFVASFVNVGIGLSIFVWMMSFAATPVVQYPGLLMLGIALATKFLIWRGQIPLSRYMLIVPWALFVVVNPLFVSGVRTPSLLNVPSLLILTAWMLGRRALVIMSCMLVAVIAFYWVGESQGWLVWSTPMRSSSNWMATIITVCIGATVILWGLIRNYETNFNNENKLQQQLVHALQQSEAANLSQKELLKFNETILLNSPLPMAVFTADGAQVDINDAYVELLGSTRADLMSRNFFSSRAFEDKALLAGTLQANQDGAPFRHETSFTTYSGKPLWLQFQILPIAISGQKHLLVQLVDLTERKHHEEELRQFAFHDALTGLPNRRLLIERMKQALVSSQRHTSHGAVLFLDLDRFKHLNDTHGHEIGDALLIEVAKRLRQMMRATDTVARLGGDEFVVLLEELGAQELRARQYVQDVIRKPWRRNSRCAGSATAARPASGPSFSSATLPIRIS